MRTHILSYDRMQAVLGREDRREESTNFRDLRVASAVLRTAMELELTARQKECVRLYYYENHTMEQIGTALGISKSTVCRHLQKAKRRLQKAVSYAGAAGFPLPRND